MKVNREELLKCLHAVDPGLSEKGTVEQSSCYVFKDRKAWTFNDEMACSVDLPKVLADVECAVPSAEFCKLLSKMKEENVDVELKDGELIVKGRMEGKRRRAGIRVEQEVSLPIAEVGTPGEWSEIPKGFAKAFDVARQVAGKDHGLVVLTCLHVRPKGIEACDNYQAVRCSVNTGLEESFLAKRDELAKVFDGGVKEWIVDESWIHFRSSEGAVTSCRRVNEQYPDLGPLFKVEGVDVKLPKDLTDAVTKAETFFDGKTDDEGVEVSLQKGGLSLRAEGERGWYEERQENSYDGDPLRFKMAPRLLREVCKRSDECTIGREKLKVNGDGWVYVSCLVAEDDG